MLYKNKL